MSKLRIPYLITLLYLLSPLRLFAAINVEEGVSWRLAESRKENISQLQYHLTFSIPEATTEAVEGHEVIRFQTSSRQTVVLDFREQTSKIHSVKANGKSCPVIFQNEHIIIPKKFIRADSNEIEISFTAGNQSLNRRDNYIYTLFVPDRARTVFPCFDQPNLKARFAVTLEVPEHWTTITNTDIKAEQPTAKKAKLGYRIDSYALSDPIPTYLFAFAAGEFQHYIYNENGRTIGAYHRETDSARIAQLPEICHQVVFSLEWLEKFTDIPYPFQSYNVVILPGFQFGGMEHTGCTFYNDNTLFLSANPTVEERLKRTELIAHETSHMWFGDAVTMNWFNDVWTKEVFANYFAAEITAPLFPEVNHSLNWYKTYVSSAINQDRTEGRTSIRQPLDNMRYSGLIYNNIIYNKAPVMMRKMVEMMGKEAFQRGIQRYVKTYLYDNATWDDLIAILDSETRVDLKAFSKQWVDETYWPTRTVASVDDPSLGMEYGYSELNDDQLTQLLTLWKEEHDDTRRQVLLMTLNENYLHHNLEDDIWLKWLIESLMAERNPLICLTLVNMMNEPLRQIPQEERLLEQTLFQQASTHQLPAVRTQLLRLLANAAISTEVTDELYAIWHENSNPLLSPNDYMTLAYELAVRLPEQAEEILETQRTRITNPDRRQQFDFIARAVSPYPEERDALFASLAKAENRRIEPWTQSVLYYLNHPLRQQEAVKYILPALELLPEIQRTGDIFFPGNWCYNLLCNHRSREAHEAVEMFLQSHQDYPQLLLNKILYAKYLLDRANNH